MLKRSSLRRLSGVLAAVVVLMGTMGVISAPSQAASTRPSVDQSVEAAATLAAHNRSRNNGLNMRLSVGASRTPWIRGGTTAHIEIGGTQPQTVRIEIQRASTGLIKHLATFEARPGRPGFGHVTLTGTWDQPTVTICDTTEPNCP